jgi:hypothetical protein
MKRGVLKSRGVGMLLAVGLIAWGAGHPQPAWSSNSCSLKTLKGTYVGACEGVQGSAQTHFAVACKDQFHGDGTVSGICTSTDKDNVSRHVPYTGTYTVNPDCTGTITTTDENGVVTHQDLFFPPDGAMWSQIFTDPGFVDAGVEQRVSRDDRL